MITKEQIQSIVDAAINPQEQFVVEVVVKPGNKIMVAVDGYKGITLDECVSVSRAIEGSFDREVEDFELEVGSPGLTLPFRVIEQYRKNIGKEIDVIYKSGSKASGLLKSVAENGFEFESKKTVKAEGKKKKETITECLFVEFENIKQTKLALSFK